MRNRKGNSFMLYNFIDCLKSFLCFYMLESVKLELRNNQFRYQFQNAKSTLGKDQTNCGSK